MGVRWPVDNADQFRAYVQLADARCPTCRCDLRGLTEPECPACGTALTVLAIARPAGWRAWLRTPAVRLPEPRWSMINANALLSVLVVCSAVARHGELPKLSWLSPAVLGAAMVSVTYADVFRRARPGVLASAVDRSMGMLCWLLLLQLAGLALLWS